METDSHENRGDLEDAIERGDDGDRAPFAREDRRLPERLFHRARGGLERNVPGFGQPRLTGMNVGHRHVHRLGGEFLDRFRHLRDDLFRRLVGNQAHRDLRVRLGGDHRLGAVSLEAAPDPVDLERGPSPDALERRESRLAEQHFRADRLSPRVIGVGELQERLALFSRQLAHLVVKAGDLDLAFGVLQPRDDVRQRERRIDHRTAERPRVQVSVRSTNVDL